MGQLKQSRARKRGFPLTVYFTQADEPTVDQIQTLVSHKRLKNTKRIPFKSFSEFIREAMHEKLQRDKTDDSE